MVEGRPQRPLPGCALYLLGCLIFSGLWMELDRLGPLYAAALLAAVAFFSWTRGAEWISPGEAAPAERLGSLTLANVLYGAAIAAPALVYVGLTWNQEFPFLG